MTIFARIIAGDIPCHRVYEDAHVLAFLDINPLSHGHVLVIPKEAVASLNDLPDEAAAAIGRVLPRVGRAVLAASGADAYNILLNNGAAAGQEVEHVHFHVIPAGEGEGLQKQWTPGTLDTDDAVQLLAAMHAALEDRG